MIPDNTLGVENSIVMPQQLRDLIEGGAIRGSHLLPSFREFNLNSGQNIYFANAGGLTTPPAPLGGIIIESHPNLRYLGGINVANETF